MHQVLGVMLLFLTVCAVDVQGVPGSNRKEQDGLELAMEEILHELFQKLAEQDTKITTLQNTVEQLQQRDNESLQISFHARLRDGIHSDVRKHEIIKFDFVLTNQGAAYNSSTGKFTAPVNGVYVFLFSTRPAKHSGSGRVYLHVEGKNVAFIDNNYDLSTGHFVCHLDEGGKVWVAGNADGDGTCHLYSYGTTFTGFLLSRD